jgi:hypothetical protein
MGFGGADNGSDGALVDQVLNEATLLRLSRGLGEHLLVGEAWIDAARLRFWVLAPGPIDHHGPEDRGQLCPRST